MKKKWIWVFLISFTLGTCFWYFYRSLWLERLMAYGFSPAFGKAWETELQKFRHLYPMDAADCIFLGDSQMEQCEWQELIPEFRCINRGIGGEPTSGLLMRLNSLAPKGRGKRVFLQTGVNDLFGGKPESEIIENYGRILDQLLMNQYVVVPTLIFPLRYLSELNMPISRLNEGIKQLAVQRGLSVIDINPLITEKGILNNDFSNDGVHLNADGYRLWLAEIRRHLPAEAESGFR